MEGPARRAEMLLLGESRAEIKWGRGSDQPTSTQCSTPSPKEHLLNPAITTALSRDAMTTWCSGAGVPLLPSIVVPK